MLVAIILIYMCYYFKFPIPIIIVAWINLYTKIISNILKVFKITNREEE